LKVNWFELRTTDSIGKVLFQNAFISNHQIDTSNVADMVAAGRARWKIENENINTLKTKGYHLSHNFGQGKKYLSSLLACMNLLAFLCHTVLDMINTKYLLICTKLSSRKMFFQHIQTLTCYHCFTSFDALLDTLGLLANRNRSGNGTLTTTWMWEVEPCREQLPRTHWRMGPVSHHDRIHTEP